MELFHVEYAKIIPKSGFRFHSDTHSLIILSKTRMHFEIQGTCFDKEPQQMCCCLPGWEVFLLPGDEYGMIDLCEFRPTATEEEQYSSLPLPLRGPNAPPNFSELSARVKNISFLFFSADKYRLEKTSLDLWALLYSMSSGDEDESDTSRAGIQYQRMRQLRKAISDDPTSYGKVGEAADFIGLSPSRFEHLYKQYFNISYIDDLLRSKIKRSCMLLNTTEGTVSQIAAALGYESETLFYRQFKKSMGVSPGSYRAMSHKLTAL